VYIYKIGENEGSWISKTVQLLRGQLNPRPPVSGSVVPYLSLHPWLKTPYSALSFPKSASDCRIPARRAAGLRAVPGRCALSSDSSRQTLWHLTVLNAAGRNVLTAFNEQRRYLISISQRTLCLNHSHVFVIEWITIDRPRPRYRAYALSLLSAT